MTLQKHARSKCVFSPLLRVGFCIMLQNFVIPAYATKILILLSRALKDTAKFR